jgi:hypothetical protein
MSSTRGCPYGRIICSIALKAKTRAFSAAALVPAPGSRSFPVSDRGPCSVLADITSCLGKPPFANPSISRSLTLEDIRHILDSVCAPRFSHHVSALSLGVISEQMVGAGVCEWTSPDRNRAFIWWKSPDEWANELHKYALRTGEAEIVETVAYFESEAGSPVLGMPEEVILRICQTVPPPFFSFYPLVISRLCRAMATHVICSLSARTGQSSWLPTRVILAFV